MLRPPYTSYDRLHVYHLDIQTIPPLQDPDLIGVWGEDDTSVLFFHQNKDALVDDLCVQLGCNLVYQAELSYQEWEAGLPITSFAVEDVTVAPVWETTPADIRLDPSVIFGSGFHPTTRLCLKTLLSVMRAPETRIRQVLDLGTGTGLLAIAAALSGADKVIAVDNNPLACATAQANCRRNRVDEMVSVRQEDLRATTPQTGGYDLVIANLYRDLLKQLIATPSFWQARYYILSGFIQPMEAELLAEIPGEHLHFLDRVRADRWCIWLLAKRQGA